MRPVNFSMREGCHWHLSEILKAEKEFGHKAAENKIIEFLDLEDGRDYYGFLEEFLCSVFEQECAARMAVFQYLCAKHRICYTEAPAYMHYMPNMTYDSYTGLLNDENEYPYLSNEVKNKLAEYEKLTTEKVNNPIILLTEQITEKDKQIEALMQLLQKQKDNQQ